MRKIAYILAWLLCTMGLSAQVHVHAYLPNIKTLKAERLAWVDELRTMKTIERPFLVLNDGLVDGSDDENTLLVSFDEMSHDVHMYSYSVQHLNYDGSPSGLTSSEYLNGFTTGDIRDYEHSLNTTRAYTHYAFRFPNEDMQLTKSGKYRLLIYEDNDPDKRVGEVEFLVVEPLAQIVPNLRYDTQLEINGRYQQLEIELNLSALSVRDPNEFKVVVEQNNRLDNQVVLTQPTFVQGDRLRYVNKKELVFEGGNEYRHFDSYSTYFAGMHIDRISFFNNDYHALLMPDECYNSGEQYIHEYDANGMYVVNAERTNYVETEAEYMWVHWTLPVDKPWLDGAVYVGGDLFENRIGAANRMDYDERNKCYYLNALVKQGGYNYQYWFVSNAKTTTQRTDGSYWQTGNQYAIYVYYRPFGARYDRLIGLSL